MRCAYTQLRTGRPYPVLLEMPNDVLAGEISEEQFHYKPQEKRRSAGDPRYVSRVAELLINARAGR